MLRVNFWKSEEKDGLWLAECPSMEIMTQGKGPVHAIAMICDAVRELSGKKGFSVGVILHEDAGEHDDKFSGYFDVTDATEFDRLAEERGM